MSPAAASRYKMYVRIAGVALIGAGLVFNTWAWSILDSGPQNSLWSYGVSLAGVMLLGLLTLVAADHIRGERPFLPTVLVSAAALTSGVVSAGYFVWLDGVRNDWPDWALPFTVVASCGWAFLLLVLALREKVPAYLAFGLSGVLVIAAIGNGLHQANTAFAYPLHAFIQTVSTPLLLALVLFATGARRWHEPHARGALQLAFSMVAVGLAAIGSVVWVTELSEFRIPREAAIQQSMNVLAPILLGLVITGVLERRVTIAMIAAPMVFLASVGSIVLLLNDVSNRAVILGVVTLPPLGVCLVTLAFALAFESYRDDQAELAVVEDDDGDFQVLPVTSHGA